MLALMFEHLPVLGVGVSLSLSAQPDPVALVQESLAARGLWNMPGQAEVERVLPEVERIRAVGAPVLFHPSYINFCGTFSNAPMHGWRKRRVIWAGCWFALVCAGLCVLFLAGRAWLLHAAWVISCRPF
jgi:hypothetical protein